MNFFPIRIGEKIIKKNETLRKFYRIWVNIKIPLYPTKHSIDANSTEITQEWKEFSSKNTELTFHLISFKEYKNTKTIKWNERCKIYCTIDRTTDSKYSKNIWENNSRVLFSSSENPPWRKFHDKSRNTWLEKFGLTVQLMQTPPPRNFPRMSMDILPSATSWSYLHEVACPLQLHFSQWKPFAAVPGFHGIWLYMGQHFSHLSPHVWRSHSHSWCYGTIPPLNAIPY